MQKMIIDRANNARHVFACRSARTGSVMRERLFGRLTRCSSHSYARRTVTCSSELCPVNLDKGRFPNIHS